MPRWPGGRAKIDLQYVKAQRVWVMDLLRTNLSDDDPAQLLAYYIQLTELEQAFTLNAAVNPHRGPFAGRETHWTGATNRLRRRGESGRFV